MLNVLRQVLYGIFFDGGTFQVKASSHCRGNALTTTQVTEEYVARVGFEHSSYRRLQCLRR
jgi:hypothetical protein